MLLKIIRAENLPASDVNGTSDPFVKVLFDGREVATTPRVRRDLNPRWDAVVALTLAPSAPLFVVLEVWDRDELSANDLLGALRVPFPDWRPHVAEFQQRQQRERQRAHAQLKAQQIRERRHAPTATAAADDSAQDTQRRSRSLNASGALHRAATTDDVASAAASECEMVIKPVLIWSRLVKGPLAQGRLLCSVQFEPRDLRVLAPQPYGARIQDVFLPQNPRFAHAFCHLPRSWHPDAAVRQDELAALRAGTPKDCLFPWRERVLHMVEEVTVTFHVNESNQGVLATLLLTNYRVWFVPYKRVRGLVHEDVHTVPVGKILRASVAQQKRSNNNNVNVLVLENMDAGQYHVTLSPISRLRDAVRDFSRDAEARRAKQLLHVVAEIEWLRLENSFCATTDLNHVVAGPDEERDEDDLRYYSPRPGGSARPPVLARAMTEQFGKLTKPTKSSPAMVLTHPPSTSPAALPSGGKPASQAMATPPVFAAKRRIQYHAEAEFRRQGVFQHPRWRPCALNKTYDVCATYPSYLVVPASLPDEIVAEAATFRSKSRFPALTWLHPRTGAPLCRSSQPNTGMLRSTNAHDRELIWAIRDAALPAELAWQSAGARPKKSSVLHIVDARPELNAKSNALTGKGHESVKQYDRDGVPTASITFMGIDNIHVVRSSFAGLAQALYEVEDANFFGAVQKSRWLEHVCSVLQGASEVAAHLERGDAVLVHCSDGWDRTAQLSSLAQLMLDPYFRTLEGFAILIEKDWCAFGHMFKKRCGHPTSDQTSPIFPQFLDAVYQLTLQFPTHFQFNELFLSTVADAVYSSWHGTFQMNSERERRAFLATVPTVSVWDVIRASTDQYLNPLFVGGPDAAHGGGSGHSRTEPMRPVCRVRLMQLWVSQYQKAISHMRLQQREFEMLLLIRQQETELSRLYAVLSDDQQLELRAFQLRSDIASLARSMNLEFPDEPAANDSSAGGGGVSRSTSGPATAGGRAGKRAAAASIDFHDLVVLATATATTTADDAAKASPAWAPSAGSADAPPPLLELSVSAVATASSANVPNARRRKSLTSRSRSNSLKLKNSILSMMGHAHDSGGAAAAAAAAAPALSALAASDAVSALAAPSPPRPRSSDVLRREVHRLEEQLARMNHQVALKEDAATLLLRHFRHYNYNLPESVQGFEYDSPSPTHATNGRRTHRATSTRHRHSTAGEGAKSPSSSSSQDSSSSATSAPFSAGSGGESHQPGRAGASRSFAPGSSPLLTTTKVISAAGSFRNSQPVWERDGDAPCCKRCKKKFKSFYRPRHHCRCCGYVFCGRCTSNRMNLPEFGYYDVVRVCNVCYTSGEDG
ncbi:hypothetical protein PybrP1_007061 [[Pythium] brassicae (nom. inval.)]|nr:hypothetical protein PybrP1_007061 [[Pythium] brassicae (nom. inval.)]